MQSLLVKRCAQSAFASLQVCRLSISSKPSTSTPLYILGTGNIGNLIAHSIRTLPTPIDVKLLVRRQSVVDELRSKDGRISLQDSKDVSTAAGFTAELIEPAQNATANSKSDIIERLIVTTKTYQAVDALRPIHHRFDPKKSVILFLQNGQGVVSEVENELFPDPALRPQLLKGIISHGVHNLQDRFAIRLAGKGEMWLELPSAPSPEALALYELLTCSPMLSASCVDRAQFLQASLEKLVMNATINPLTAIENIRNGELLNRSDLLEMIRLLLMEMAEVFRNLPEVRELGLDAEKLFAVDRMYGIFDRIARVTKENLSSTTQDVRYGRKTEIDYINGWIVRKGAELGVPCPTNEWVVGSVKEKEAVMIEIAQRNEAAAEKAPQ